MVVWCTQNLRRDGSSFMWHQPCQCCNYTTSVDIPKRAIKKASHSCKITCERSESARERRTALYNSRHLRTLSITSSSTQLQQQRPESSTVTDNFGLFIEIAVCKFLRGWWSYGLKPFFILFIVCVYTGALFISAQLSTDAVSALPKVWKTLEAT